MIGLGVALAAKVTWYAMPTAGVDTDDGFGAGARGAVAWQQEGFAPYKFAIQGVAYFATSGYQSHQLRFDRTGIGVQRRWRITLNLAFRRWLYDRYYGLGNLTLRDASSSEATGRSDPRFLQYRYRFDQPLGQVTFRYELANDSPWEVFLSQAVRYAVIETYEGSLLEEESPYGLRGGGVLEVGAGLLHDTRQPEIAPRRGHFYEVSARVAPSVDAEAGGFVGGFTSLRWYAPVGGAAVLAHRTMAEMLVGTVPFYEMVHWGGSEPIPGFGGGYSLRGVPFGRWRGPGKAVSQTELRWTVLEHALFGDPFAWELAPWVDVGTTFGAGVQATGPTAWPVHPGAGAGIRVMYDKTFVGRVDTGWGVDPQLRADGSVEDTLNWGVYVLADHPF